MTDYPRILIVDDDPRICRLLCNYLGDEGFHVATAACGDEMWQLINQQMPDLVILDLMLPGEDGLTIARKLRSQSSVGIIILTGKGETIDKIIGLEIGADDYLAKPFDNRELLARIRSVFRRIQENHTQANLTSFKIARFGDWVLDIRANELKSSDGEKVKLTEFEFQVLLTFINNVNRELSRDQILTIVSGHKWNPSDRSVDVVVGKLRRKLKDSPDEPLFIKTIRTRGYKFTAPVEFE